MTDLIAQAEALKHSANCKYPDGADDCPKCNAEIRAQAQPPAAQPVALPCARCDTPQACRQHAHCFNAGPLPDPRIAEYRELLETVLAEYRSKGWLYPTEKRIAAALKEQ